MRLTSVVYIVGKQLDLCKAIIIFYHLDCFCLQEKKRKMKEKYFAFLVLRRLPQQKSELAWYAQVVDWAVIRKLEKMKALQGFKNSANGGEGEICNG